MEAMNAILDEQKYRDLVSEAAPVVIRTEGEYRRLLKMVEVLMEMPEETISTEEGRLLEMLAMLVEEYEDRTHPLPQTDPHKMLSYLLEEKGLRAADVADILPKSRVSEILNGKRGISKTQAKKLAERLRVPIECFL